MYAVFKTGGKQYRAAIGETIRVESLAGEIGQQVTLTDVLAVGTGTDIRVGSPVLEGSKVTATVVRHGRGPKIWIFKMQRRKHFQKNQGHRQNFTELRVDAIA